MKYIIVVIFIGLVSCSGFERLRRSGNTDLMYRMAFEYYHAGDFIRAGTLFDDLSHVFRGTVWADTVAFYQAMSYFNQRDYLTASHLFNRFFRDHRLSPFAEEAEFLAAYCYYMQSPRPELDQSSTYAAIDAFQLFLIRHPESRFAEDARRYLSEMRDKLVDKSFLTAVLYYNLGQYRASIIALNNSLEDYPDTRHREELMFLLLRSNFLLAENSIPARRLERFQSTVDEYYSFIGEFPESRHIRDAQRMYERADRFVRARGIEDDD